MGEEVRSFWNFGIFNIGFCRLIIVWKGIIIVIGFLHFWRIILTSVDSNSHDQVYFYFPISQNPIDICSAAT